MKTILLACLCVLPFYAQSQTNLTRDYDIYAYYREDSSNKNNTHIWLYDGESYSMNFPRTVTGLQNAIDKAQYITLLSDINSPTTNDSILPTGYEAEENIRVLHELITEGKAMILVGYHIGDKRLTLSCSDKSFVVYITDNN